MYILLHHNILEGAINLIAQVKIIYIGIKTIILTKTVYLLIYIVLICKHMKIIQLFQRIFKC